MENFGIPSDEQWNKMKRFIRSDKYTKDDFFVFETQAVGDRIVPNRFTQIMPSLLQVMKDDATKGVSLMLNHNWSQLGVQSIPIGKVFDGRIGPGTQEGETTALYTTQYILRDDSKLDGYSKNDIIKLIESGILSDTSIGWGTTPESYKCSICGNGYYSGKCQHFKGVKYVVNEETNEVKQCIVQVGAPVSMHEGNNVLIENSIVFDGAYPNAEIQSSADGMIETTNGKFSVLNDEKIELQETQRIIAYSNNNQVELLYKPLEKGGKTMEDNTEVQNTEVQEEVTEVANSEVKSTPEAENVEVTETQSEETVENTEETEEVTETQATEITDMNNSATVESDGFIIMDSEVEETFGKKMSKEEIMQLAKEGKAYKEATIQSALNSGIRSMGNSFNKEVFEKTFANMNVEDIKAMGAAWENEVSEKFHQGRISKDIVKKEEMQSNHSVEDYGVFKTLDY